MAEGIEKPRCRRCHRQFTLKYEGQEFGRNCARILLKTHIEVKNTEVEVVAVIV